MRLRTQATARRAFLCLLPVILGACTTVGGAPRPVAAPTPGVRETAASSEPRTTPERERPSRALSERSTSSERSFSERSVPERVVEIALAAIGTPYAWGGTDDNGFDCSGLIQFAYGQFGIRLPRRSTDQIRAGSAVPTAPELLRPGDVLGFSGAPSGKTSHVGLYVGEGNFIHSSTTGVRVSTLGNPYWQDRLVAARRIAE